MPWFFYQAEGRLVMLPPFSSRKIPFVESRGSQACAGNSPSQLPELINVTNQRQNPINVVPIRCLCCVPFLYVAVIPCVRPLPRLAFSDFSLLSSYCLCSL